MTALVNGCAIQGGAALGGGLFGCCKADTAADAPAGFTQPSARLLFCCTPLPLC